MAGFSHIGDGLVTVSVNMNGAWVSMAGPQVFPSSSSPVPHLTRTDSWTHQLSPASCTDNRHLHKWQGLCVCACVCVGRTDCSPPLAPLYSCACFTQLCSASLNALLLQGAVYNLGFIFKLRTFGMCERMKCNAMLRMLLEFSCDSLVVSWWLKFEQFPAWWYPVCHLILYIIYKKKL